MNGIKKTEYVYRPAALTLNNHKDEAKPSAIENLNLTLSNNCPDILDQLMASGCS